jgi:hypothetical protein
MSFEDRVRPLAVIVVTISALVISFSVIFKNPFEDPDLGWHLVNGFRILREGSFPFRDTYSWTMPGYPYADSWWLSEVLLTGFLPRLGFGGLALLFTLIGVGSLLLLTGSFQRWREQPGMMGGLFLVVSLITGPVIGTRGQTLSFFFFSSLWICLRRWLVKPGQRRFFPAPAYFLPLFFLLWANFHAAWVLGMALLFLVLGTEWLRIALVRFTSYRGWLVSGGIGSGDKSREEADDRRRILVKLSLFSLVSVLATLVNPYGWWLHRSIWQDASSVLIKNNISEWLAPNFHDAFGMAVLFWLGLVTALLVRGGASALHPVEAAVFLFVSFNAFTAVRNTTYLISGTLPFVVDGLRRVKFPKLIFGFPSFQLLFWPLLAAAVTAKFIFPALGKYQRPVELMKEVGLPVDAVRYVKTHRPGDRVFNEYGWGGFMVLALPEVRTFIDGRMPGWGRYGDRMPGWGSRDGEAGMGKGPAAATVFQDYIDIVELKDDFAEEIDSYRIDWFWLEKDLKIAAWLRVNPEWKAVYEDNDALIFRRSSAGVLPSSFP